MTGTKRATAAWSASHAMEDDEAAAVDWDVKSKRSANNATCAQLLRTFAHTHTHWLSLTLMLVAIASDDNQMVVV